MKAAIDKMEEPEKIMRDERCKEIRQGEDKKVIKIKGRKK